MTLFWLQLRGETRKLFARKRTFIGFGAFLVFEIVVLFLLRLPPVQRSLSGAIERMGYDPTQYLSGLTLGLLIVAWTVFLLEALFLALVAGDVVSKEVEDGTLRMMLCRPISRTRILTVKVIVALLYTIVLTLFVGLTALAVGLLNSGPGGLFVVDPPAGIFSFHDFWPGLTRYAIALPLLALSLCTVTLLAFCLSCFNMKPAAATIITLSLLFADVIVRSIPFFEGIRGWFLTTKMSAWIQVFQARVPWEMMVESYVFLFAINVTLFVIGWAVFERRDFKS